MTLENVDELAQVLERALPPRPRLRPPRLRHALLGRPLLRPRPAAADPERQGAARRARRRQRAPHEPVPRAGPSPTASTPTPTSARREGEVIYERIAEHRRASTSSSATRSARSTTSSQLLAVYRGGGRRRRRGGDRPRSRRRRPDARDAAAARDLGSRTASAMRRGARALPGARARRDGALCRLRPLRRPAARPAAHVAARVALRRRCARRRARARWSRDGLRDRLHAGLRLRRRSWTTCTRTGPGRTPLGRAVDRRLLEPPTCVAFRDIRVLAQRAVLDAIDADPGGDAARRRPRGRPGAVPARGHRPAAVGAGARVRHRRRRACAGAGRRARARRGGARAMHGRGRLRPRRARGARSAPGRRARARPLRHLPRRQPDRAPLPRPRRARRAAQIVFNVQMRKPRDRAHRAGLAQPPTASGASGGCARSSRSSTTRAPPGTSRRRWRPTGSASTASCGSRAAGAGR